MRTVIDLPDEQIEPLKTLASSLNISRTELIQRAVADYLRRFETPTDETAFGIWKQRGEDGLAYQERMHSEWDRLRR
jgi:predicted transcriptional regulator